MKAVVLLGLLLLAACQPEPVPADSGDGRDWGAVAPPAQTLTVEVEQVQRWREVPATVKSLDHIAVAAEVEGRVLQVLAELGDRVTAGQALAKLDPSALRSRVEAAQAALDLAEAELQRVQRLVAERVASEREADAAESLARQARAHLELAESALDKATVLAPADAIVEAREVSPGDLAIPGRALFALYDPTRLVLEAQVPLDDRDAVPVGAPLLFELDGQEGKAAVFELAPTSDLRSRTLRVRLRLPAVEELHQAAPGSFGLVRYPAGSEDRIGIPQEAAIRAGQLEMVLALGKDGYWRRRAVRFGAAYQTESGEPYLEVLAGLQAGDRVGWSQ